MKLLVEKMILDFDFGVGLKVIGQKHNWDRNLVQIIYLKKKKKKGGGRLQVQSSGKDMLWKVLTGPHAQCGQVHFKLSTWESPMISKSHD